MGSYRRRLTQAAFVLAVALTLTMAWLPHPPPVPGAPNDKLQHIVAFLVLAALGAAAFPEVPLPQLGERLSFLGAVIELVQSVPALHRDCDLWDWLADTAAVVVVLMAVAVVRRRWGRDQLPTSVP